MQRGARILFLFGVALLIFFGLASVGVLVVGILTYEHVDVLNNPLVAALLGQNSSAASAPGGKAVVTDKEGYGTENNWIAAHIATEIAQMTWLAVHLGEPMPDLKVTAKVDPHAPAVHLELSGWSGDPVVDDLSPVQAWDARSYSGFARQLLAGGKAVEPAGGDLPNVASDLLTPTGVVLARTDVDLSARLTANPASVTLHEDAALLLLTLALRENARSMSDARIEMNRACAHLALARALRGGGDPTSNTGLIAEAALTTLSGREIDALPQVIALTRLSGAPTEVQVWAQVLMLFNKDDWRFITPEKGSPLLLKIAWFQTVVDDLNATLGQKYLATLDQPEPVPDWGRALLSNDSYPPVEVGHIFCASTIELEFRELADVLNAEGSPLTKNTPLRDVFKNPVGPSVVTGPSGQNKLRVVGLDLFEDIAQRHLICEIWATHFWMKDAWGVPDQDAQFTQQMRTLFKGTRDEPYLLADLNLPNTDQRPAWGDVSIDVADLPPAFAMDPTFSEVDCDRVVPYFGWGIPFGAPFDLKDRTLLTLNARLSHHHRDPNAPDFRALMPLAPDSYPAASWPIVLDEDLGRHDTSVAERSLLERFFDYNINALGFFHRLAEDQADLDDATLEELLRKKATLDPDDYFSLGDFLASRGRADEAADAYRKGAQQGNDQVLFANSILPLIQYDFAHNQQDEAMSLAKRAAEVYSYDGLDAYAWLLCKLNRKQDALDVMKQIKERYGGDPYPLFYAAHGDLFPEEFAAEQKKLYPDGMPTVTLADFTKPPSDGCQFTTSTAEFARAGLKVGDVVVALDSHPVHSDDSYSFVRAMSDAQVMDLIVWRKDRYIEIKASPPNRHFGNSDTTYRPAPKPNQE